MSLVGEQLGGEVEVELITGVVAVQEQHSLAPLKPPWQTVAIRDRIGRGEDVPLTDPVGETSRRCTPATPARAHYLRRPPRLLCLGQVVADQAERAGDAV